MFPLLEGIRILEVGQTDSARYCGKILAELGAEVSTISSVKNSEERNHSSQTSSRDVFEQYLNQNKLGINQIDLADKLELINLAKEVDLCIMGYEVRNFPEVTETIISNGTSILAITPFGLQGSKSKDLGGDLIASHSSGYAYHLAFPTSSAQENPPRRGPEGQSLLFAGMLGAVAAIGEFIGHTKGQPATLIDLSEQEASVSLLFEELAAYNEGHLPAIRQVSDTAESSAVAGGLVGILPCTDGYIAVSPREQHQWKRVVEWLGYPIWAELQQFSSPSLRMENWRELQKYLSEFTGKMPKEQVFRELQEKKVACFPINSMKEIFSIEQLNARGFWQTFNPNSRDSVTVPGLPFLFKSVMNNIMN